MKYPMLPITVLCALCALADGQTLPPGTPASPPVPDRTAPPLERTSVPTPAQLLQRSNGSLLRANLLALRDPVQAKLSDVSLIAVPEPAPRKIRKHDLVTIIVREESAFSSEGKSDLKRQNTFDARLEEFIKLSLQNKTLSGGNNTNMPSIKGSSQRDFKGEATVDRTDSLTLRVTAEVADVKPNNTLVLQARKTIKTDEEEQYILLSGVCRAEDVTADNSVLSTQLADVALQKSHKGAVRDTTERNFLDKLFSGLSLF